MATAAKAASNDWSWVPLGTKAEVIAGQSPPSTSYNRDGRGLPFFQGKAEFGRDLPTATKWCTSPTKVAREGDILISIRAPVGPTNYAPGECAIGRGLAAIRPGVQLDGRWIRYWLEFSQSQLVAKATGTTFEAISGGVLRAHLCPCPSIEMQRQIVGRIDELFSELDNGEEELRRARAELETYRKSLLKAAVTGELTADWRAANPPQETGADLLQRLLTDRHARWKAEPKNKDKAYKEPVPPQRADLSDLPEGWIWTTVGTAGDVLLGRQRAPMHHSGDHMRPYLRVANVMEGRLDLRDVKEMNFTPKEFEIFSLRYGDVLLNEGQSPDLLGRPAMYREEIVGCCFQKTLLRFRPSPAVTPEFALIVFRRYMHGKRFLRESRITTNIGHLTQVRFLPIEFPLPPIAEQREIAERVETAEASGDLITRHEIDGDAAALRQSILASAFRGELVQ